MKLVKGKRPPAAQSIPDGVFPVAGYPETDIGKDDVRVKGRYMSGTGTKTYSKIRGTGAATRGTRFLNK